MKWFYLFCLFVVFRPSWANFHSYGDDSDTIAGDTHNFCRAFGSGAVTICFYDLGLSWLRFEHPTFRLRGEYCNNACTEETFRLLVSYPLGFVLLTLYVYIFTDVHITHDLWFTKFFWVKWRFNEPFFIPSYNLLLFKYKKK